MGFVMDGLAAEAYDRTYTDAQLLRRIARYFRPFAGMMVFVSLTIFLTAAMDALLPVLISRGIEDKILPTCRALGIGITAYGVLARGLISGHWSKDRPAGRDFRSMSPRFQGENFQRNLDVVTQVHEIAGEKGCTPSQLALAWLLAQGEDIVPIPGTKQRKYLEENLGAVDVALTSDDLQRIEQVAPKGFSAGDRYPDMSGVNL